MLRDVAITRIQDGLGFRTDLSDKIALRMQETQRNLEKGKTLPWFLIQEDQTVSVLTGVHTVTLPTGFIRESEFQPMRYFDSTFSPAKPVKVPKKTFEAALDAYGDAQDGAPQVYVLRETTLYFFPLPDANYTLYWSYYKGAALLDTNIENAWLANAPELIIGDAGARIALDMRDQDAVEMFRNMRDSAWSALFNEIIIREEAARRQAVGSAL